MPDLPLNALRAFETAARTGSFAAAASELGVTSAAVSQQVKALEDQLQRRLFDRLGNRIVLTDAGRAVYPRLETAFSDIAAVTSDLREAKATRPFVLSILPSLAELWALPRIRTLAAAMSIEVRVEPDPVVFGRDGADLRLTYGAHLYPDHRIEPLFRDRLVPIASPSFRCADDLSDVPDHALIHTDWGPEFLRQPSWTAWFAARGVSRKPDRRAGLRVGFTVHAVAAAKGGAGIALVPDRLVADEVTAGVLRRLSDTPLPLPWDYVMVFPHAFERRRALVEVTRHFAALAHS